MAFAVSVGVCWCLVLRVSEEFLKGYLSAVYELCNVWVPMRVYQSVQAL